MTSARDSCDKPDERTSIRRVMWMIQPIVFVLSLGTSTVFAQGTLLPSTQQDPTVLSQGSAQQLSSDDQGTLQDSPRDSTTSGAGGLRTSMDGTPSSASNGLPLRTSSLSAHAIISFLEQNPDVTVELKGIAADRIRMQGGDADENSITDQQLYDQIAMNASLRSSITMYLLARGYEIEDDESPTDASPDAGTLTTLDTLDMQTPAMDRARISSLPEMPVAGRSVRSPEALNGTAPRRVNPDRSQAPTSTDTPKELHQPAPYNLRALRDLYTQVPDQKAPLRRFGSDLFALDNRRPGSAAQTSVTSASNVPIGPDYVLGPGDTLSIELWGGATLSFTRTIERDGRILLPEAGSVQVAGLSMGRAEALITGNLKKQYRNAQVAVTVGRLRSVRVYVTGDVRRPGAYEISALATPLNALDAAGGPAASGSLRVARHMRADKLVEEIDLYDFFVHGVHASGARFESNDVLFIPPAGPQVAVSGAVRRPAIYELKPGDVSLESLLNDAGGLLPSASLGHVVVERIVPGRDRETLTLTATEQTRNFIVRDGDRIKIDPVLPYSERVIYLEGHLARPGRIAYRDGMRLSDAIHSYRDLLPEPAARAEILRLMLPDMHIEAISFDLAAAFNGKGDISLQPFDTIRIHSRYETDAPRATINGEVLRPGVYPLSEGMTAAQLVRMAGGFKRDAFTQQAELTSYVIKDGSVTGHSRSVAIGSAVNGLDPTADVPIKPGDILSVYQLTGWENVGESIRIEGQVRFPGTYGFEDGERLSSVLRRAGGLLPTAYPMGAVLVRDQVRELEQKSREELIRQIQANSAAARLSPNLGQQDMGATLQLIQTQQEQVLADLKSHPPAGRMVIHIASDINTWANTAEDIELRRGDVLTIPKQPGFVLATGQVYNATALTFTPDKTASWYLSHAGGTNTTADRKEIFIIRANGSVIGRRSGHWLGGDVLNTRMNAGDVIVVPQKIIGRSLFWRNLLTTAQLASSIAITAAVASI